MHERLDWNELSNIPEIGCFYLYQCQAVSSPAKLWSWDQVWTRNTHVRAQLCLTLCDPMNCGLPGFSVHRISQARVPEWAAISYSRRSCQPRDQTCYLLHCRQILLPLHHLDSGEQISIHKGYRVVASLSSLMKSTLFLFTASLIITEY